MNNTLVLFDPNNALEETEKEIDKQFIVEGSPKTRLWKCFISEDNPFRILDLPRRSFCHSGSYIQ